MTDLNLVWCQAGIWEWLKTQTDLIFLEDQTGIAESLGFPTASQIAADSESGITSVEARLRSVLVVGSFGRFGEGQTVLLIAIWILICLAPAGWEWKPVMQSASWAEAPAFVTKTIVEPSKTLRFSPDEKSGVFDETHVKYEFKVSDKSYTGSQDSTPHFSYFSHFPTDIVTDFKPGTRVLVRYQLDDPRVNACPDVCGQYLQTALAQGAMLAVIGALALLIFSVGKSAM